MANAGLVPPTRTLGPMMRRAISSSPGSRELPPVSTMDTAPGSSMPASMILSRISLTSSAARSRMSWDRSRSVTVRLLSRPCWGNWISSSAE